MTLNEAIQSGRSFRRGDEATYATAEEFLEAGVSLADYNATDYEVEPVTVVASSILVDAWNTACSGRSTIAKASESRFFADFKAALISKGVSVE